MGHERRNDAALQRYSSILRSCVEQSKQAGLTGVREEIRESDRIFRAIFENATDGMLLLDLESRKFTMANQMLCQMLGYDPQELKTLEVVDIHPEKDLPDVIDQFEKQIRGELTLARDLPVKRKNGSVFYADINAFPITFNGKTYLMGVFRDTTERRNAEEELRRSEETFRLAMEATNDALWDWNVGTNEVYRNPRFAALLGYEPHELTTSQEEWKKRIHPDDQPFVLGIVRELAEGKRDTIDVEYRLRKKSGDYIWIMGRGKIVEYNDDGSPARMVGINVDITERKKVEDEFRKFKTVADRAGYGVAMSDLEGRLTYTNEPFAQMHGYKTKELIGRNLSIFHNEDQMKRVHRLLQQIRETGSFVSEEVWHTRRDGTEFCALMNGTLITDENGEPRFMASTAVDISFRKDMETALAASEEKYKTIVENSGDGVVTIDRDGVLLFVNKTAAKHMGGTPEDFVGKTLWDVSSKDIADRRLAEVSEVIRTKQQMELVRQVDINGRLEWRHIRIEPITYGPENVTIATVIARDIDRMKRAEEQVRILGSAVEQSIDGVAIKDLERRLRYVNTAYAHMHGYTPEEMIGMPIENLHNTRSMEQYEALVHHLNVHGSWSGEVEHMRKDKTVFPCYVSVSFLKDDQGRATGRLALCRDMTESQKRDRELTAYREQMAHAEQLASLGTLSATIAHQVTQPLTVIRLSLDNVLDELERISCPRTVLRKIRDSVTQVSNITAIINQFRSYARQSSDTAFGQVSVHAVVVRVARLLAESAKAARATLLVQNMSQIPPVYLHEREFEQILFALIENAIQAADGKELRRIVISGSVKDDQIELRFSDTCGGIAPEIKDKIFEPFFTTKSRDQGTGLGLCIVRDAVARVGGRVRVESEFGKGSTFFVTLPVDEG